MKPHPTPRATSKAARRLAPFCLTLLLLSLASCGPRESEAAPWLSFGRDREDSRFADSFPSRRFLRGEENETGPTGDLAFGGDSWLITPLLLAMVAGLALFGGASLGSRARKERDRA